MTTEFISVIADSGGSFTSLASALAAQAIDITSPRARVYSHDGVSGTVANSAGITGSVSGEVATVKHCTSAMVLVYHGAADQTYQSGETVTCSAGSFVINSTVGSGAGDLPHLVWEISGELTQSAGFMLSHASLATGPDNKVIIRSIGGQKRSSSNALTYGYAPGRINCTTSGGAANVIDVAEAYVDIENIDIKTSTESGHTGYCIRLNPGTVTGEVNLRGVLCKGVNGATQVFSQGTSTGVIMNVYNSVFYGNRTYIVRNAAADINYYNCIFIQQNAGNAVAAYSDAGATSYWDCYAVRAGTSAAYSGTYDTLEANCASNDATGTAGLQNFVYADQFMSTTENSEDFRLKSDSGLLEVGEIHGLTPDIFGVNRDGASAIGPCELVSSGITASGSPTWGTYKSNSGILCCPTDIYIGNSDAILGTATPSNILSFFPHFSAYVTKLQGANLTDVYIQVSSVDDSTFLSDLSWDSGWKTFSAPMASNGRIDDVEYLQV
jgi:hypothetical protein